MPVGWRRDEHNFIDFVTQLTKLKQWLIKEILVLAEEALAVDVEEGEFLGCVILVDSLLS